MATAAPPAAPQARAAGPGAAAPAGPPPSPALVALQKRVRLRTLEGLKAARMRPQKPTYFMLCVGNVNAMAYMAPIVGSSHKSMLRQLMGKDSGLKYHRGQCKYENGYYMLLGPTVQANMRKKLEQGLLNLTGRRWRVRLRREDVEESQQRSTVDQPG